MHSMLLCSEKETYEAWQPIKASETFVKTKCFIKSPIHNIMDDSSFPFLKIIFILYVWLFVLHVCLCMKYAQYLQRPEDNIILSGTGVR